MRKCQCYTVHLVGNTDSVKRMVVSFYLVHGKKQKQTLKVLECAHLYDLYRSS